MPEKKIRVQITGQDAHTAYIALPGHRPVAGIVSKTLSLDDIIDNYRGPRVHLDFSSDGQLIGVEILA